MKQYRFLLGLIAGVTICLSAISQSVPTQRVMRTNSVVVVPPPQPAAQANPTPIDKLLAWDAMTKEVTVTNGTPQANFVFNLTNISSGPVTILNAHASCGCTVAKLPQEPWVLASGTNSELHITMNLAGKVGEVTKTVTINTDSGIQMLYVKSNILPPPAPQMGDREANQKLALTDRQAVFKGDCATCHTEPARNKMGLALYTAACGVCHEAEHRASMVPNLHALKEPTSPEFWRNWIAKGKEGTLMPAFSQKEGGILSDAQIESLVTYLNKTFPPTPQTQAARPAAKLIQ